ncbi:MAG: DNA replication and repair protein RecF [Bacteroidales bacterium]|jgi:DNA replication and repair protein RecF|nr:DNA replication and repair protein RecF [Bacteroidales bacterium]
MLLKRLELTNFKIHDYLKLEFSEGLNYIVGDNGIGKTSILDSIYYLGLTRNPYNITDNKFIQFNKEFFLIKGFFYSDNNSPENIEILYHNINGKKVGRNEKFYKRFSSHLGLIPMVFICPSDIYELVYNQENRRKLIDQILSQQSSNYLNALQNYQKLLQQRNHLLKQQNLFGKDFSNMLNAIDTNIIPLDKEIYKYRTNLIADINKTINNIFYSISNIDVPVSVQYVSNIDPENLENLFNDTLENDLRLTHTTIGIHRDKLYFLFNNDDISQIASQGQQKLFIIALKLSLYQWLSNHYNEHAILLLDDIFDKLDKYRTNKLLEQLQNFNLTQIFITDTDADRIANDQVNNLIVL